MNSADEREVFRKWLPGDKFEIVELSGEDWMRDACRREVRCDVLVVSGHFAGREFYSSRPEATQTVKVEDIERAQCGQCPGLFAGLKEVYLFGCDSLKAEPTASAMPEIVRGLVKGGMPELDARALARTLSVRYGEASRDLMRRLFPGVPVIYGFASLAPYGRVAGPMLERWFAGNPRLEVGTGVPSARLLSIFAPSSMVVESGLRAGERDADFRAEACLAVDDQAALAPRIEQLHARLAAPMPQMRMAFGAAERFVDALPPEGSRDAPALRALARLAADADARGRYLAVARDTGDPALRLRMVALARAVGWLDEAGVRDEHECLARDLLASPAPGFADVDLLCSLNQPWGLTPIMNWGQTPSSIAHRAMLACLGQEVTRPEVIRALASAEEGEVDVARAYLRHRPLRDAAEGRLVGLAVAHMASVPAQVRALEGLARLGVDDREVQDELLRLYARTRSAQVQAAVAEIFFRSDPGAYDGEQVARVVRERRLPPTPGSLVDALLRRVAPEQPAEHPAKAPEPS